MAVNLVEKVYEGITAQVGIKATADLNTPANITIKDITNDANGVDLRFVNENPAIVRDKIEQLALTLNKILFDNPTIGLTQLTITPLT